MLLKRCHGCPGSIFVYLSSRMALNREDSPATRLLLVVSVVLVCLAVVVVVPLAVVVSAFLPGAMLLYHTLSASNQVWSCQRVLQAPPSCHGFVSKFRPLLKKEETTQKRGYRQKRQTEMSSLPGQKEGGREGKLHKCRGCLQGEAERLCLEGRASSFLFKWVCGIQNPLRTRWEL